MPWNIYGTWYLIMINLIAVAVTAGDKRRAKKRLWRVPEHTLLAISALGGSPAMLLTMLLIRHKTKHPKFMVDTPIILLLQSLAVLFALHTIR